MAIRKWNVVNPWAQSPAPQIQVVPDEVTETAALPLDGDLLDLQGFAGRLGSRIWKRRQDTEDLILIRDALRLQLTNMSSGRISVMQTAYAAVGTATIEALLARTEEPVSTIDPERFDEIARVFIESGGRTVVPVNVDLVRSVLQPLLAGDRRRFRSLLATLGGALALLDAAGFDGRIPNITFRPAYQQFSALLVILNGVLDGSRRD